MHRRLSGARRHGRRQLDRRRRRLDRLDRRGRRPARRPAVGRLGAGAGLLRPRRQRGDRDRRLDRARLSRSAIISPAASSRCSRSSRATPSPRHRPAAGTSLSSRRRSASIASSTRRWPRASASCRSARATIRAASRCCRSAAAAPLHACALADELGITPHPRAAPSRRAVGRGPAGRADRARGVGGVCRAAIDDVRSG